jgi:hypothetical protein
MPIRPAISATLVLALTGCSSLALVEPREATYLSSGSAVAVIAEAQPGFRSAKVTIDGNDVTSQMRQVSPQRIEGTVALPAGISTIVVDAQPAPSYFVPYPSPLSVRRRVCVLPSAPSTGPSKSAFSVGSGQSWGVQSTALPRVINNGIAATTRWQFDRLGGPFSTVGLISSVDAPCRCLRSSDPAQGAPIALAMCDPQDTLQQWQSLAPVATAPAQLRFQNFGRGASDACLTEGAPPARVLIQLGCQDTPNQLWTVRDTATNAVLNSPW